MGTVRNQIKVLNQFTANQIAAGEVVERPMSVVKELVENSIDAGATAITIETSGGGLEYIRVSDNGSGIPSGEVETAFLRHATSKITSADDLASIETLGFRGEALASIAAVAHVVMKTRTADEDSGAEIRISGGTVESNLPAGVPEGTTVEVSDLFYNVPARLKFIKSARTESANISDYVSRMIIARPDVAFKLTQNGKLSYHSSGDGKVQSAMFAVYGSGVTEQLKSAEFDDGYIKLTGFVGTEQIARPNRNDQSFFVNGRYIKSMRLSYALQRAYDTRVMTGRFPLAAMLISISPNEVDVNVHPNKLEVRFHNEERVMRAVTIATRKALGDPVVEMVNAGMLSAERPASHIGTGTQGNHIVSQLADKDSNTRQTHYDPDKLFYEPQTPRKASLHDGGVAAYKRPMPPEDSQTPPVVTVRSAYTKQQSAGEQAGSPAEAKPVQASFGLSPYRIVGQLFECYLIVQQDDDVFFIDQHAAHERRIYERLTSTELRVDSQILLVPEVIRLSPLEHTLLMDNIGSFTEIGFEIEDFGSYNVSVHAVPYIIGQPQTERFLHEAVALFDRKNKLTTNELKRSAIVQTACKYAIKAGQTLDTIEIEALLAQYASSGVPLTCPHGRPVMIRMSKLEFEKLFKRVV